MGSYQLTLSPNYVPNWGMNEALREIFQNGIDRENETEGESKFNINYDPLSRRLILGNPDTCLHKRTLLLGETSKDGKSSIGKYGEGYKLALLVLLRLGCRITIENYNEIWIPRLVKSRVFDAELIQIDTSKNKHTDGWLRYIIDGIIPEHYSDFQDQCLMFHTGDERIETRSGQILLDKKYSGKVYCNTLFVCSVENLKYGYNIKPQHIELDRDRKKVSEFNLTWETSSMWTTQGISAKLIYEMQSEKSIDVQYYDTHAYTGSEQYQEICELHYKDFLKKHGTTAVVCKDEIEARLIKEKYGSLVPIVVPEEKYRYIVASREYKSITPEIMVKFTPSQWINNWLKSHGYSEGNLEGIAELKAEATNWRYKE